MTPNVIHAIVFMYFLVGGMIALGMEVLTYAFTGKHEPWAILAFFVWPIFLLIKVPWAWFGLLVVAAAGGMTWLVSVIW